MVLSLDGVKLLMAFPVMVYMAVASSSSDELLFLSVSSLPV